MAQVMGGELVLQLLQEFRESQRDFKQFKQEMLDFKHDMLGFKQDYMGFKHDMLGFKQDYMGFKHDMLDFKHVMEVRMNLMQRSTEETIGYLQQIVKMLQNMGAKLDDTRQRVSTHADQLDDHEQRLERLEEE